MKQIVRISIYVLSGAVGEVWQRKRQRGVVHRGPADVGQILRREREPNVVEVSSQDGPIGTVESPLTSELRSTAECRDRMLVLSK